MKKIFISLALLVVGLFAVVLVAPSFVDWNSYRADISQQVQDATGRKLHIGGDISFSLLPAPVLQVSDVHLANAPDARHDTMVSIRQLDVSVALMPLLGGNIHVRNIRLIEPVIHLEMMANGKGNWVLEDESANAPATIETVQDQDTPQLAVDNEPAARPLPIQVDDFIVENAQIIYEDPAKGVREEVSAINSRFAIADLNGPFEAAGTLKVRNIPVGFAASVGQIVHGRSASFSTQLQFAHGNSLLKTSGTFIDLVNGPQVKIKVDGTGDSLAGLISAFDPAQEQPGALNRAFKLDGEVTLNGDRINLGEDGLALKLGNDQGRILLDLEMADIKTVRGDIHFNRVDGDAWVNTKAYQPTQPNDLPLVIDIKGASQAKANAIPQPVQTSALPKTDQGEKVPLKLPNDIDAEVTLSIDALTFKGKAIRQIQTALSLSQGDLALERASAILPGAGEINLVGIAGNTNDAFSFDGSLDVNIAHLPGLLNWLEVDTSNIPSGRLAQLQLSTDINLNPEQATLNNLLTTIDGSTLKGAVVVALRSRPSFGASLNLDRINLDAYLPQTPPVQAQTQGTSSNNTSNQTSTRPTSTSVNPLATFDILNQFDANLNVNIDQLTYQKQDVRDLYLEAGLYNKVLNIKRAGTKDLAGVALDLSGQLNADDKGLLAQNLSLNLSGKKLDKFATLAGVQDVLNWSKLGRLDSTVTLNGNLLAPQFDLNLKALGSHVKMAGKADIFPIPKADGRLNANVSDLDRVVRALDLGYRPSGKVGPITVTSDIGYSPTLVRANNIQASINKTPLTGQLSYTLSPRTKANITLNTGVLTLDPLLPRATSNVQKAANRAAPQSRTSTSPARTAQSTRWSNENIDTAVLKDMDLNADIFMKGLRHQNVLAQNIVLKARSENGTLTLQQGSADIFDGTISINSVIKAGDTLDISAQTKASGLNIGKILQAGGTKATANGALSYESSITSKGQSEYELISNLNGPMTLQATRVSASKGAKGSIIDVINFLSVLSGRNRSNGVADVSMAANLTNGVAQITKGDLTSKIANGDTTGTVDLVNWQADINGTLNVAQNALIGLLAQKAKMKSSYPFSIQGDLDAPNIKLDSGGISSGGGLAIPLSDDLEKKGVGTLLRGVLGAAGVKTSQPTNPSGTTEQPATNADGTLAPPPPPSGSTSSGNQNLSKEQLIFKGLNNLLNR